MMPSEALLNWCLVSSTLRNSEQTQLVHLLYISFSWSAPFFWLSSCLIFLLLLFQTLIQPLICYKSSRCIRNLPNSLSKISICWLKKTNESTTSKATIFTMLKFKSTKTTTKTRTSRSSSASFLTSSHSETKIKISSRASWPKFKSHPSVPNSIKSK